MGVASFIITHSDPIARFLLPISANWDSVNPEVLVPKGEKLPPSDITKIPLNWKLKLLPGHLGLLMPLNQYVRKKVNVLAGVTNPDYPGEIELLLYNGGKEEYI